jgi:hypothetical protein
MVMQLPRNCVPDDLKAHFSKAGPVRDAKMIADRNSRRSKGIAYVEFVEPESVAAALAMNGERMGPAPLIIMMTQSEKNRQAALKEKEALAGGPCRVAVVNLPPDLTSAQLRVLFEPFAEAAGNTKIKEAKVTPPPPREAEDLEDPDMELVLPGAAGILEFEVCEAPPQRSLRTLHHHLLIGPREIPPPPTPTRLLSSLGPRNHAHKRMTSGKVGTLVDSFSLFLAHTYTLSLRRTRARARAGFCGSTNGC